MDTLGVLHLDYLDNGYLYDFNDTSEGIDDFGYFYVEYDIKGKPTLLTTTPTRVTDINEYLNKGGWVKIGKEKDS